MHRRLKLGQDTLNDMNEHFIKKKGRPDIEVTVHLADQPRATKQFWTTPLCYFGAMLCNSLLKLLNNTISSFQTLEIIFS